MIRTGGEIKEVCFVQHAEKQLILCVHVNAIGAYDFLTGEKLWQKKTRRNHLPEAGRHHHEFS